MDPRQCRQGPLGCVVEEPIHRLCARLVRVRVRVRVGVRVRARARVRVRFIGLALTLASAELNEST